MADNDGRFFLYDEARDTWLRVFPVAGTPAVGDGVVVNADFDLEFTAGTSAPDAVITNHTTPEVVFSRSGQVIYSRGS